MIIEKNGKKYEIIEYTAHWLVRLKNGDLTLDYQIPKEICKNSIELKDYIYQEKMF